MDEINQIKRQRFHLNITMKDISKTHEEASITLRKERMFSNLMAKRQLKSFISIAGNTLNNIEDTMIEVTQKEINSPKTQFQQFPLLSQLPSSKQLLRQLKQSYYTQNDSEIIQLLEEMNTALGDNKMIKSLLDNNVVLFVIKMFLSFDSEKLFYICSSLMVQYTFKTDFASLQLNSVKILDRMLYEAFNSYTSKDILTNILMLIWNIYNDFGNGIISQTQLLYYLKLLIISEEQFDQRSSGSLKEAILLNLYSLINNTTISLKPLKPQINQIIPYLLNEINYSEEINDNCEQLIYTLSMLSPLSNDDEICLLMLKEGAMNCLCDLFQYLFLTPEEIFAKKILVLNSKCVNCILKLFGNFFCMTDTIISAMLPQDLFFSILMKLIRLHSSSSIPFGDDNKIYLQNQAELMALVANIAACDIISLMDFIGEEKELIKVILSSYVGNHNAIIHIIHIIDNIAIRNNLKAMLQLHLNDYLKVIETVLTQNTFHSNTKIEAINVLIRLLQITEFKIDYRFNLMINIKQKNILHYVTILFNQSQDTELVECCNVLVLMLNQIDSTIS